MFFGQPFLLENRNCVSANNHLFCFHYFGSSTNLHNKATIKSKIVVTIYCKKTLCKNKYSLKQFVNVEKNS